MYHIIGWIWSACPWVISWDWSIVRSWIIYWHWLLVSPWRISFWDGVVWNSRIFNIIWVWICHWWICSHWLRNIWLRYRRIIGWFAWCIDLGSIWWSLSIIAGTCSNRVNWWLWLSVRGIILRRFDIVSSIHIILLWIVGRVSIKGRRRIHFTLISLFWCDLWSFYFWRYIFNKNWSICTDCVLFGILCEYFSYFKSKQAVYLLLGVNSFIFYLIMFLIGHYLLNL